MFEQENLIECDNCDFVIPNEDPRNPGDGKEYINKPYPKCGENLLTQEDYDNFNLFIENFKKAAKIVGLNTEIDENADTEVVALIKVFSPS